MRRRNALLNTMHWYMNYRWMPYIYRTYEEDEQRRLIRPELCIIHHTLVTQNRNSSQLWNLHWMMDQGSSKLLITPTGYIQLQNNVEFPINLTLFYCGNYRILYEQPYFFACYFQCRLNASRFAFLINSPWYTYIFTSYGLRNTYITSLRRNYGPQYCDKITILQ